METTRKLLFTPNEETTTTIHKKSENEEFIERTTLVEPINDAFSTDLSETPRTILSTTSRQGVNLDNRKVILLDLDMSSSTPRIFTSSNRPTSFGDLLPRESVRPPKLKKAESFEELLRVPKLLNDIDDTFGSTIRSKFNTPTSTETIELEKRRLLIKEALERIKKNREQFRNGGTRKFPPRKGSSLDERDKHNIMKMRFRPNPNKKTTEPRIYPTLPTKDEKELQFINVDNKFSDEDYEEQSTWGPVKHSEESDYDFSTHEYEYTTEYEEDYEDDDLSLFTSQSEKPLLEKDLEKFQKILEEHTESNFGINIMSFPNRMESTLLRLLKESKDPLNKELDQVKNSFEADLLDTPDANQDPLLRQLNPGSNQNYQGEEPPIEHQDPFLKQRPNVLASYS